MPIWHSDTLYVTNSKSAIWDPEFQKRVSQTTYFTADHKSCNDVTTQEAHRATKLVIIIYRHFVCTDVTDDSWLSSESLNYA
jgi:hypothetical protein